MGSCSVCKEARKLWWWLEKESQFTKSCIGYDTREDFVGEGDWIEGLDGIVVAATKSRNWIEGVFAWCPHPRGTMTVVGGEEVDDAVSFVHDGGSVLESSACRSEMLTIGSQSSVRAIPLLSWMGDAIGWLTVHSTGFEEATS